MRPAFTVTMLAALAAVLAGCAAPEEAEQTSPPPEEPLAEPGAARADCGPEGSPAGYDQTGSLDEHQVGTGTGDITSETSCVNETRET